MQRSRFLLRWIRRYRSRPGRSPLKLVLLENPGHGGTLNHPGVEVATSDTVHAEIARLTHAGLFTQEELHTTCSFAAQDKVWVTAPAVRVGRFTA
jgi:hypothetical protein